VRTGARVLRLQVRDVGYVLPADEATRVDAHARADGRSRVADPTAPGARPTVYASDARDGEVTYGDGSPALRGIFDLSIEGTFAGGIDVGSPADSATDVAVAGAGQRVRVPPSYGPWSTRVDGLLVGGGVRLFNTDGTRLRFGTVVARPNGLSRSCDLYLPIQSLAAVESIYQGAAGPGIRAGVLSVQGIGERRTATMVFSSYLQGAGYSHQLLLDWVEEYTASSQFPASNCASSIEPDVSAIDAGSQADAVPADGAGGS
jgi:hypothetical protein